MAGKPGIHQTTGIPFPAKDQRYNKVWTLMKWKGKTLEEALAIVGSQETGGGAPPPEKKRGKRSTSGIPFPVKDPRYKRVKNRIQRGETLEEALADADTIRSPGKKSPEKPPEKKKSGNWKGRGGNGMVQGKDLLNHEDVPDHVKDKIQAAQGETLGTSATGKHPNKSQLITIPITLDLQALLPDYPSTAPVPPLDLAPVLSTLQETNTRLAEIAGTLVNPLPIELPITAKKEENPSVNLAPLLAAMAETNKKIDKITVILGAISREVTTIAQAVIPGAVGHVDLKDPAPLDRHGPITPPEKKQEVFARQTRAENGHKFPGLVKILGTRGPLIQVKDLTVPESRPVWRESRNFEIEKAEALAA